MQYASHAVTDGEYKLKQNRPGASTTGAASTDHTGNPDTTYHDQ